MPALPLPFSPVQRARKFSAVLGTTSLYLLKSALGNPNNRGTVQFEGDATLGLVANRDVKEHFGALLGFVRHFVVILCRAEKSNETNR